MEVEKTLTGDSADRLALARKEISLNTTQEGGLVRLYVDGPFRHGGGWHEVYGFRYNFRIRVPQGVKLELHSVNDSHIRVDGTVGDFKISNVNGPIEMTDVAGAGQVTTVNGGVKVVFAKNPAEATSFKTVNGSLDISFRAGLNADVKMKTMNGGLYTDFDVTAMPVAGEPAQNRNGKFVWSSRRMTGVRIGSGGPMLQFETLNGDVMVKNREK
jgi:type V secretory pathway adhesin AidA